MRIAFYGGQTAGFVVLLTLLASKHKVSFVIAEDEKLNKLAQLFNIPRLKKSDINKKQVIARLTKNCDFLLCCHGKKILNKGLISALKCINIHPCLYKYKGASPIKRLIKDNNAKASIGSHYMTEKIDNGRKILECFINIDNVRNKSEPEIYNELYGLYAVVAKKTLEKLSQVEK